MSPLDAVAVAAAGLAAGTVNTIVGSGSLITFPTLLAVGYSPLTANVTNTVGLVAGSVSGVGRLPPGAGRAARPAAPARGVGARRRPDRRRPAARPAVVGLRRGRAGADPGGTALVVVQPRLARRVAARRAEGAAGGPVLDAGVLLAGVYGGYFGAAQGVLLLGLLGAAAPRRPPADQRR